MDVIGRYRRIDPRKEFIRTRRVRESKALSRDDQNDQLVEAITEDDRGHTRDSLQDEIDLHADHQEISLFELQDLLIMLIEEETGNQQTDSAQGDESTAQNDVQQAIQAYQTQTEEFSSDTLDVRALPEQDFNPENRYQDKSGFMALALDNKKYYRGKIDTLLAHGIESLIVPPDKTYALAVDQALELIEA